MANFTQRPSGKWQAKIRRNGWPDQSKTFTTLELAEKWARATEHEMDVGAFVNRTAAEKTTFHQAANRFIKEVLPTRRGGEIDAYKVKVLIETFGEHSLASINAAMISSFRDDRLKVVAPATVVREINILSRIFKECTMDWGIALPHGIPTSLVRKPKVNNARTRRLVLGEWERLQHALKECKAPFPLACVEFALETAARQSEVISLTWQDVDLRAQTARLRGIEGAVTKNGDTYRDVPLSTKAVSVLSALPRSLKGKVFPLSQNALKLSWQRSVDRARRAHVHDVLRTKLEKLDHTSEVADAEIRALIFKKKVPMPKTIKLLDEIEKTDDFLKDLHFNDLRHEATSRLADKLQMHELMKVTGHKSSSMLARYYHPKASELALKLG